MNITLQDIGKSFGGRDIFSDFSLDITDGMRLCVCGPNGCGKSTLIRIMAGKSEPDSGRVIVPKGCRLGYVEQILEGSDLEMPLLEWVQASLPDWGDFWREWDAAHAAGDAQAMSRLTEKQHDLEVRFGYNPEQAAQSTLSGLGFSREKWALPIGTLSGGWRERAKLARVLVSGADVLLLDEPTNHLDLDAVEWLEEFLLA
ncbi:MAG: ABC-F family ATP-binding cassette domain-containing protein, partial [Mailhella sp.]|nr:ABC-F family ATP-binding cassette domain-containing protein [Mailhella sp.]